MRSSTSFNFAVVIPARYKSSRLPGKPLVELCGVPMIVRTYRRCQEVVDKSRLFVATDDERIRECCVSEGINVIMTPEDCATGTDRVAAASTHLEASTLINVQGDEPVFDPADLLHLISAAQADPNAVINGYCRITDERLFRSGNTPKVVMRPDGRLLYMSRAAIPTSKDLTFGPAWRQVCAYAFPRKALEAFAAAGSKTPLEQIEDIEIIRFLELGWEVKMLEMSDTSVAVDCPEDVDRAEQALRGLGLA